mmetsp:Transcript_16087/g.61361  ORF Transcript_16087/g.61361 Transcript_16087/m.61361 type:complete len:107 (-) Transcript_16087:256-576(-)
MSTALLLIDPQVDFHEGGSLAVPGAIEDAQRIAGVIEALGASIDAIYVTLDTHQRTHIAHGLFWEDAEGEHPAPFSIIRYHFCGSLPAEASLDRIDSRENAQCGGR